MFSSLLRRREEEKKRRREEEKKRRKRKFQFRFNFNYLSLLEWEEIRSLKVEVFSTVLLDEQHPEDPFQDERE
jgi:hypothetical protein